MDTPINIQVFNAIQSVIDKRKLALQAGLTNNGYVIQIANNDGNDPTYIWIRLETYSGGITVNFANVQLSSYLRHKGIFTDIYKAIENLKSVNRILVCGAVTHEINNFCLKQGMHLLPDGISYYKLLGEWR